MNEWTNEEMSFLKDNYDKISVQNLAEIFDRSIRGVQLRMTKLGLSVNDFKNEIVICGNDKCSKSFKSTKKEKRKYCSHACAAIGNNTGSKKKEETKKAISSKLMGVPKKRKNGQFVAFSKPACKICGKECKHYYNVYCSRKCVESCPDYKLKKSVLAIDRFTNNPEQHPNMLCAGKRESRPERIMTECLKNIGFVENVDFIKEFKLDRYFIDFVFHKKSIAIEVDGAYWHDPTSEKEIKREKRIREVFSLIRLDAAMLLKKTHKDFVIDILKNANLIQRLEPAH